MSINKWLVMRPEMRTTVLQNHLLAALAGTETYQKLITDELRLAWRMVGTSYTDDGRLSSFSEIKAVLENQKFDAEDGIGSVDESLQSYVDRLSSAVGDRLNLRLKGSPAFWALEAVHCHVVYGTDASSPIPGVIALFPFWRSFDLKITVSELYGRVQTVDHAGDVVSDMEISSDPYTAFKQWSDLREEVIAAYDRQVAAVRGLAEADYRAKGSIGKYSGLETQMELIPDLRDGLIATRRNRAALDDTQKRAIDRLCRVIGITSPFRKL